MKIHFIALVDGDQNNYRKIVDGIKKLGHQLVTEHYLTRKISDILNETENESNQYRKNRARWMNEADIVMLEGTKQDINLGIEMAEAISLFKPVILFYKEKESSIPFSLKSENRTKVVIVDYNDKNMFQQLTLALDFAKVELDVRYNIMLPANLLHFLDQESKESKTSKAAIIRNLIFKLKKSKET